MINEFFGIIFYITLCKRSSYDNTRNLVFKSIIRSHNSNLIIRTITRQSYSWSNNKSLKEIGHTKNVKQLVLKQAALIKKSGCDGIVCSAQEALMVRKKYKNLLIITPGIRLPGDSSNDQIRIMTPKQAFENKVSGIVIGRSLTKGNIKNNTKKLIDHLNK